MSLLAPTNSDLPTSWMIPGVYIQLNLSGSGAGVSLPRKNLLLLGYKTSSGTQGADTPIQVFQQTDANTYFGAGSDLARQYAAAMSQVGGGVINTYCCGLTEPSSGTASTHLITIAGPATSAGSLTATICGYPVPVAIANGDTATSIGTNLTAAINLNTDLPVTASGTTTVTLTYKTKGVTGNDLPVIVNIQGATGVTASPGTITIANTATGNGAVTVTVGTTTMSTSVATNDTATTIATNVATTINASSNPVTATSSSGVVTLFYATDRVVHRISTACTAATTTSTAAVGTAGVGTPTLTTALANIASLSAFKGWSTSFNESTSLGTLSTHIELYANGVNQKGQQLTFCSTDTLSTAGAIPGATSPRLDASPRYAELWCPDAPQQAYELAARAAARRVSEDYGPKNYDGIGFTTRGTVPLLMPHKNVWPGPSDQNSALYSYYMTPLVVDDATGTLRILRGRTTSKATDQRLWDWGCIDTLDFYRYDLGVYLVSLFSGKSVKANSPAKTVNTTTPDSIKDAVIGRLFTWDDQDLFDGASTYKGSVVVNVDPIVPTRIDVGVPCSPPPPLHQIAGVGNLV